MTPAAEGTLLIVQHGRGRGRLHGFRNHLLRHFARAAPGLARRIRLHETGSGRPDLAGVRAAMFWLADPLFELYPDCHAEATDIAAEVRARGGTVANDPAALSSTIKSVQARAWSDAGIPCSGAEPFVDAAGLRGAVARAGLPAIVRTDLHHAQEDMHRCRTMADGGVILWGANPYFTLPVGAKGPLARARRLGPRVDRLCAAMVLYLQQLVDGERGTGNGNRREERGGPFPAPRSRYLSPYRSRRIATWCRSWPAMM